MIRKFLTILLLLTGFGITNEIKVAHVELEFAEDFYGYANDRLIVRFTREITERFDHTLLQNGRTGVAEIDRVNERFGARFMRKQFIGSRPEIINGRALDLSNFYKIMFNKKIDAEDVAREYARLDFVIKAEPVGIHGISRVPNDAQFSWQWHLDRPLNDADIDAPQAWDFETGDEDVIVAILDTGVRYYHIDLGGANASSTNVLGTDGNVWINTVEKDNLDGIDNDGNGYVDDWVGWDFVDNISWPAASGEDGADQDNDPRDYDGHGTHCAGNVAALNNNGGGLCSVTGGWGDGTLQATGNGIKVMCLRVGYQTFIGLGIVLMDAAAEALYYAADNGAKVASCSWGSSDSGGMAAAVDYFLASGGLLFHAAGNDGTDDPDYIDNRGDCISVAATDSNDTAADFTNYGTWVDIAAPGTVIWSLYQNPEDDENNYIAGLSGTSMSTPIAAGVAALIWSQNPTWTANEVEQHLYDTADDIEDNLSSTYKGKMGAGRVNAFNAVQDGGDPGIIGDVNDDDSPNSTDALIILSCDVGLDVSSFCPMSCGDVNDDGFVNSTDALIVLSYDVGVDISFPVGESGCYADVTPCAGCNP
jgi:subtilisin family serine protease